jgi:autotransporter strand-loop-strand O-heptosyltransferase
MGNFQPKGVVKNPKGTLNDLIELLQESEFFIGISSGLSWLSWACNIPTVIISGFTDVDLEPLEGGVIRIINKDVCHGCWSKHEFDAGDWNWCPEHKGTERQFECSKNITSESVIKEINCLIF